MPDYSDIQQELDDFANATYGEDVRDSMISVTKKIHDLAAQAGNSGLSATEKTYLLTLLQAIPYNEDVSATYTALSNLWSGYSITWYGVGFSKSNNAVSVQSGDSFTSTITANTGYNITSVSVTMGGVTVPGAYSSGTVTIPSVTGNVVITVTTSQISVTSLSAVYTQPGTIYLNDSLDSLKNDLVLTATFSDSTTAVIASSDYTLSGTLAEGTSTITATYNSATATFNVTVVGYNKYDYLYCTAASTSYNDDYVDTGLTYNPAWTALDIEFEVMNSNNTNSSDGLIGANNTSNSANGNIVWYARGGKAGFSTYSLGVAAKDATIAGDTRQVINYHFVDGGTSYFECNGTQTNIASVAESAITSNGKSLVLCGGYTFSNGSKYGLMGNGLSKLGYVKFSDPDTNDVLYNFVPAYNPNTSKYGYYETVNDNFYPQSDTYLAGGNWS